MRVKLIFRVMALLSGIFFLAACGNGEAGNTNSEEISSDVADTGPALPPAEVADVFMTALDKRDYPGLKAFITGPMVGKMEAEEKRNQNRPEETRFEPRGWNHKLGAVTITGDSASLSVTIQVDPAEMEGKIKLNKAGGKWKVSGLDWTSRTK